MMQRIVKHEVFDPNMRANEKEQRMYNDVMAINEKDLLTTVCEPLQLTLQSPVKNTSADQLGYTEQGQLGVLWERRF
jgi:hypothetical protein